MLACMAGASGTGAFDTSIAVASASPGAGERSKRCGISAFIMTLNEEVNIGRCLDALAWCDDIVLLDSHSTDRMVEIARSYANVRVLFRPFDNYSGQRNHGLHGVDYAHPWLLIVDADEVVGPDLAAEMRKAVTAPGVENVDAFLLRRTTYLEGRGLVRNVQAEFWLPRLVLPAAVRFRGIVHERLEYARAWRKLEGRLEHHQFDKGIDDWFARRLAYARLEAADGVARDFRATQLASRDPLARRAALKTLFYSLPARWFVFFAYNLFIKSAFLDGRAGMKYLWLETKSQKLGVREAKGRRSAC